MADLAGPLVLIGCGKMGGALLRGWLGRGLPPQEAHVVEPDATTRKILERDLGVKAVASRQALPTGLVPKAVLIAIKPQMMAAVLPDYADLMTKDAVLLSIAAGTMIARFEDVFGAAIPIVRAMPNTPVAIGKGVTALFANVVADDAQKSLCRALMAAVGDVFWVETEDQLHAVTAMSGGGPAYVFLMIEVLAKAGIAAGLSPDLAWPMARATVTGSGALAVASEASAPILRQNVTSPGGTTEAALEVLMAKDGGLQRLFGQAVAAASDRSRQLASS